MGEMEENMRKKFSMKVVALPLTIAMTCVTPLSSLAFAAPKELSAVVTTKNTKDEASESERLKQAILKVKEKITIESDLSEFDYQYNQTSYQTSKQGYFRLRWYKKDWSKQVRVSVTEDGFIFSYEVTSDENKTGLAVYRKKELEKTAENFLKLMNETMANQTMLVDSYYDYGNYVYLYHRVYDGIEVSGETVEVSVNAISGQVNSMNAVWNNTLTFPKIKNQISKEDAVKTIQSNLNLELVYKNRFHYNEKTGKYEITPYLAYTPKQNYLSVDATSGKIYTENHTWEYGNTSATDNGFMDSATATGSVRKEEAALTDGEQEKVDDLSTYLSKEEAIKVITQNNNLYLDADLSSVTANLSKQYRMFGEETRYIWYIQFEDPRPVTDEYETDCTYAFAQVDAKTGELLRYDADIVTGSADKNKKVKFTKKESQKKAENFLKHEIGAYYDESKITSKEKSYILYFDQKDQPVYGGYQFEYHRYHEDIEYAYNYINVSIDAVSGKVYSFSYNWNDDITFESTKNIISQDVAKDILVNEKKIELVYEPTTINHYNDSDKNDSKYSDIYYVEYQIRGVYMPEISYDISAISGDLLSSSGEKIEEIDKTEISYADLEDNEENKEIYLLAEMEIGFEGGYFYPDKAITKEEFEAVLGGRNIEVENQNRTNLTKQDAAELLIEKLGYREFSKIPDIFKTGYADEDKISKDLVGAVAILKGLGILEDSTYFEPNKLLTRREAMFYLAEYVGCSSGYNWYK